MSIRMLTVSVIYPNESQKEIAATWEAVKKEFNDANLEPVWLTNDKGACFLVDEDGPAKGLEYNPIASVICGRDIVGPAALVRKHLVKKVLD